MDQIQNPMAADAQPFCRGLDAEGISKFPLEQLDGIAMYQAYRAASLAGHVQLAFENPFLHESGNGSMPKAKHLGRRSLADPGSLSQDSTVLGSMKQTDLAAEMATRIVLDKVVTQGLGRHRVSQFFQFGGMAQ